MRKVVPSVIAPCSFFTILVACVVYAPLEARAAEFFVGGANASDGNPGTREAPIATIGAVAAKLEPGDIVNIRGTHNISGSGVYIGRNGAPGKPIVFRSAPGEMAKITGQGLQDLKAPITLAGNYLQIRDLEIADTGGFGVLVYGGSNIEIVGNTIHDCHRQAVFLFAEENAPWPSDILVENNKIYRAAKENMSRNKSGNWPGAISTQRADRVRVIGNTIYQNWGEGVVFNLTNGSVARGNTIYDNFSANMYMDHARDCVFEKNFVYSTGNEQYLRNLNNQWAPASGIQMANEDYGGSVNTLQGNRVINNIVVGGGWGFFYGRYGIGGGMKQTLVANNTFVGATRAMLHVDGDAHTGATFANNIFMLSGGGSMTEMPAGASSISFKNNLWQGGAAGPASGAGDVSGDPQLANSNGRSAADFKIAASSPARGKGTALSEVTDDFWGAGRRSPPDVGAHQQDGSSPNPSGSGGAAGSGGAPGSGGSPAGSGGNTGAGGGIAGNTGAAGAGGGGASGGQGSGGSGPADPPDGPSIEGCACHVGSRAQASGGLVWLLAAAGAAWGASRVRRRR